MKLARLLVFSILLMFFSVNFVFGNFGINSDQLDTYEIRIDKNMENLVLSRYAMEKLGKNRLEVGDYIFMIEEGVTVSSNNVEVAAIRTGDFPSNSIVRLHNYGLIVGKGGRGGDSNNRNTNNGDGNDGEDGGPAIELNYNLNIENNGQIFSGGGGGGAGGIGKYCNTKLLGLCIDLRAYYASGGGGGGAASMADGGNSASNTDKRGERGKNSMSNMEPGVGGSASFDGQRRVSGAGGSGGLPGEEGKEGEAGLDTKGNGGVMSREGDGGLPGFVVIVNDFRYSITPEQSEDTFRGREQIIEQEHYTSPENLEQGRCELNNALNKGISNSNRNHIPRLIRALPEYVYKERPLKLFTSNGPVLREENCQDYTARLVCEDNGRISVHIRESREQVTGSSLSQKELIPYLNSGGKLFLNCFDIISNKDDIFEKDVGDHRVMGVGKDERTNIVVTDPIQNKTFFINDREEAIEIDLDSISRNRTISVYRNDVFLREEQINPKLIGLFAHNIRSSTRAENVIDFVQNSYNVMTSMNITKRLTYNSEIDRTLVRIDLSDVASSVRNNLTIYQIISKSYAEDIDQIKFINDGSARRIVVDRDPVIGWYFEESSSDESIEYELEGDSDGGGIIITTEPILFNDGELIITYRETECNANEVALFELESLENSRIFETGSGRLYTVCISHLYEELIKGNSGNLVQEIFNYEPEDQVSYDMSMYSNLLSLSVTNTTPIFWDKQIQRNNPSGNYSCLGSIVNHSSSLFGDCGFSPNNRIWLHLGEDTIPPTTALSYPTLSHTLRITLDAKDNVGGAGVDKTYYCIDDFGTCDPNIEYSGSFTITCPNNWGCLKYARFYSTDLRGNVENINTRELRLIDRGSACQADCTAKPSPNRFLKECRNLNGCTYAQIGNDQGETIANRCDMLIEGSYVPFNSNYDIMCPNGPLRETMFTSQDIDFRDTLCDNLVSIPYVGIIDGVSVVLRVITCQD